MTTSSTKKRNTRKARASAPQPFALTASATRHMVEALTEQIDGLHRALRGIGLGLDEAPEHRESVRQELLADHAAARGWLGGLRDLRLDLVEICEAADAAETQAGRHFFCRACGTKKVRGKCLVCSGKGLDGLARVGGRPAQHGAPS